MIALASSHSPRAPHCVPPGGEVQLTTNHLQCDFFFFLSFPGCPGKRLVISIRLGAFFHPHAHKPRRSVATQYEMQYQSGGWVWCVVAHTCNICQYSTSTVATKSKVISSHPHPISDRSAPKHTTARNLRRCTALRHPTNHPSIC